MHGVRTTQVSYHPLDYIELIVWFAFEENTDGVTIDTSSMVVGDRGLVVRSYSARLGGVQRESTSFEP